MRASCVRSISSTCPTEPPCCRYDTSARRCMRSTARSASFFAATDSRSASRNAWSAAATRGWIAASCVVTSWSVAAARMYSTEIATTSIHGSDGAGAVRAAAGVCGGGTTGEGTGVGVGAVGGGAVGGGAVGRGRGCGRRGGRGRLRRRRGRGRRRGRWWGRRWWGSVAGSAGSAPRPSSERRTRCRTRRSPPTRRRVR